MYYVHSKLHNKYVLSSSLYLARPQGELMLMMYIIYVTLRWHLCMLYIHDSNGCLFLIQFKIRIQQMLALQSPPQCSHACTHTGICSQTVKGITIQLHTCTIIHKLVGLAAWSQTRVASPTYTFSTFLTGIENLLLFMQQPAEKPPLHNNHYCITFIYKVEQNWRFPYTNTSRLING